jgi:hypothetical protein
MLHRLRTSPSAPPSHEPSNLVLACHGRIRELAGVARAVARAEAPPREDVVAAAVRLRRYFTEALPLHEADEETTIAGALRGLDPALDAALATMANEHRRIEDLLALLVPSWAEIEAAPERLPALRARLAVASDELGAAFDAHLAAEEIVVVPRLAALAPERRRAMASEMRARRA